MFNTESEQKKDDGYVIRHNPNRIILFIENTKWYWPTLFLIIAFALFILFNPSSTNQSNAPTSPEASIILFLVLFSLLLVPFYTGVKLGAKLYKPQESHLTKHQLKVFDDLLGKGESLKVEFIKKDGKVEILAREQE